MSRQKEKSRMQLLVVAASVLVARDRIGLLSLCYCHMLFIPHSGGLIFGHQSRDPLSLSLRIKIVRLTSVHRKEVQILQKNFPCAGPNCEANCTANVSYSRWLEMHS